MSCFTDSDICDFVPFGLLKVKAPFLTDVLFFLPFVINTDPELCKSWTTVDYNVNRYISLKINFLKLIISFTSSPMLLWSTYFIIYPNWGKKFLKLNFLRYKAPLRPNLLWSWNSQISNSSMWSGEWSFLFLFWFHTHLFISIGGSGWCFWKSLIY